ncbi:MAG: bifunctional adenosylcobinamide kinase/adenosylcobinamide-phosphate guanylyltransferase [bacterium]
MAEFKNIENNNKKNKNKSNNKIIQPVKIFFTGGISSGKSKYAEDQALSILNNNLNLNQINLNRINLNEINIRVCNYQNIEHIKSIKNLSILHFVATANSLLSDNEMKIKIAEHKAKRSNLFIIHEDFDDLKFEIDKIYNSISVLPSNNSIILIDSMTAWLSGIFTDLTKYNIALSALNALFDFIGKLDCSFIFVSDNLSFNLVPQDEYVRKFINLNGLMEQKISSISDFVYLVVAGNILKIK